MNRRSYLAAFLFLACTAQAQVTDAPDGMNKGIPVNTLGYFMHSGGHGTIPSDWDVFYRFLEMHLKS